MKWVVKVTLDPSQISIGFELAVALCDNFLGMWSTSFFDFLCLVPVFIICSPSFLECFRAKFAVLDTYSLVGRMNALLLTYREIQCGKYAVTFLQFFDYFFDVIFVITFSI